MAAKSSSKTNDKSASKLTAAGLGQWNKWFAALYAVQGAAILVLSAVRSYPVTTNFLGIDTLQTQVQGHRVAAAGTQHLFDINLAWLVAAFLLIAAVAHGLAASKLRRTYEKDLKKGVNKIRWIEYAFSGGLILVAIGLLVGVQDISTLLLLFGLMAVSNLLGLAIEVQNSNARSTHWLSFIISRIAGALPWVVMAIYLAAGAAYGSVPTYAYWIGGTMFVLFTAVHVNLYLQSRKVGKWTNYLFGERVYMILSMVAKTALAWQIFAGSLHT